MAKWHNVFLKSVPNLFVTGIDPASIAGMAAAAAAVAGEYPPPGTAGGPQEFLTGPPGQGPQPPSGGSPGEFLAPSGTTFNIRPMFSSRFRSSI